MGFFGNKKLKQDLALVFDIGSSSVGGAIFEINNQGVPTIIASVREAITLEDKLNSQNFLPATLNALKKTSNKLHALSPGKISKSFCVLSSPWVVSQTRIIKYSQNSPFVFTRKIFDSLVEKEAKIFEDEYLNQVGDSSYNFKIIEWQNMQTTLNGYVVTDPIDKKTDEVSISVFFSMAEEGFLELIEETIFKDFHIHKTQFSSYIFASFMTSRGLFTDTQDFILLDIAGEFTDIGLVKKGILTNSMSYPLGKNYIIRGIASETNSSLTEAKSFIALYKDGHALEALESRVGSVIKKLKTEWSKGFQESLFKISEDVSVPATIFISVDQDLRALFKEVIEGDDFNQYTLAEPKFKIVFLDTQNLHDNVVLNREVNMDPFLILEAIYLNRFFC